ncbi:hypothetical protein LJR235_004556 [Pararhizobium sp. LjRoot235]|uniref:hypothetical protein n=1 Tax=Pararhizobium sp. LjRoot235 TaxID=3342291 RepID=UPI003ECE7BA9
MIVEMTAVARHSSNLYLGQVIELQRLDMRHRLRLPEPWNSRHGGERADIDEDLIGRKNALCRRGLP